MRVAELIQHTEKTAFSFELLPPVKGMGIEKVYADIDKLLEFDPKYINITTHRSEYVYRDLGNGMYERTRQRRRPGTVSVATAIFNKYGINVVPHMLCSGFTREEIEYILLNLQFLGITDLLVLRGDKAKHESAFHPEEGGHAHAIDLAEQINAFNRGELLNGGRMTPPTTAFSYGVACYPEKHEEAPNPVQDLLRLKEKVDAGADYAVTQLFYDNRKYFDFVQRAQEAGIRVPIIPGIKPFSKLEQIRILPRIFHLDLPQELVVEVMKCTTDAQARALGIEWGIHQCRELMARGVPSIHFYAIGAVDSIREIAKAIY